MTQPSSSSSAPATWSPGLTILALLFFALIPVGYVLQLHEQLRDMLAPEISLARPYVALFLFAIPGVALLLVQWHRSRLARLDRFVSHKLVGQLVPGDSPTRRRIKGWFLALAWTFLLMAWAGPQWGTKIRILKRRGIDVIIAVDVSESMLAKDAPTANPNQTQRRLQLARRKVRALMQQMPNERIGVIAFAGKPVILCPLTTDHNTCAFWLDSFEPRLVPYGGTALASTIQKAIPMFATSGQNSKAMFLLTDGDDHEKNTLDAAKAALKKGIRVYSLGFGSTQMTTIPASQLPAPPAGEEPDPRPIQTRLNAKLLKNVASTTKGIYRHAEVSHRDIKALYENARSVLKSRTHRSQRLIIREERFPPFLSIGLVFLLLYGSFRERK